MLIKRSISGKYKKWRVWSEESGGEWRVERWREESGEKKEVSGEWRVESGGWRVESGEWRVESGAEWSGVEWGDIPRGVLSPLGHTPVAYTVIPLWAAAHFYA